MLVKLFLAGDQRGLYRRAEPLARYQLRLLKVGRHLPRMTSALRKMMVFLNAFTTRLRLDLTTFLELSLSLAQDGIFEQIHRAASISI